MAVELSVAIIFKDEIRCLERCLKSLLPLREYLSLEIVMADTGSTDGSRAVAEQYADILIDFPWIDDFAAARNAALSRCSGVWTLVIDCDEWLEADRAELTNLLRSKGAVLPDGARLRNRSYATAAFEEYTDVYQLRLLRMAAQPRYEGAIHEQVRFSAGIGRGVQLEKSLLHHDGYVMLNDGSVEGKRKRARNTRLLRAAVAEELDSLCHIMELLDAAGDEPDYLDLVRDAVARVEAHGPEWEKFGPPILRKAVQEAHRASLPEWDEWVRMAWRLFPESWYTRIDVRHFQMTWAYVHDDYEATVEAGERYLSAYQALRPDLATMNNELTAPLLWGSAPSLVDAHIILSDACRHLGRGDEALRLLRQADWQEMAESMIVNAVDLLARIYQDSEQDMSDVTTALWSGICSESRGAARAVQRKETFLRHSQTYFTDQRKQKLEAEGLNKKPVWGFLLPLAGQCLSGNIAALLASQTPGEADAALGRIDDLTALPVFAFVHALKTGAEFPIPSRPLAVGEADRFALALRSDPTFLRELALFAATEAVTDQEAIWAHSLTFSILSLRREETPPDTALLRGFVRAQSRFLSRCYSDFPLQNPTYLPSAHRFALHLVRAFAALGFPTALGEVPGGTRAALGELRAAALAAPVYKTLVSGVLDLLVEPGGRETLVTETVSSMRQ